MDQLGPLLRVHGDWAVIAANLTGAQTERIQLPKMGDEFTLDARSSGLIEIRCDNHEWMKAFAFVDPHPFHAVTDSEGQFSIEAVPVGTYKLQMWHETLLEQQVEVIVSSGQTSRLVRTHPPKKEEMPKEKSKYASRRCLMEASSRIGNSQGR
jgi:Polysaccharide lyase family 4, domain II